jgi:hypothetical protein
MGEYWIYSTGWPALLLSSIWWELMYVQWSGMCIVTFQTSWCATCSMWHAAKYLWCNSGERLLHSSSELVIFMIALHSHLSLSNTARRCIHLGKERTVWWPGSWRGRCWWTITYLVSQNMFIKHFTHSVDKIWRICYVLQPHIFTESSVSKQSIIFHPHTFY